MDDFSKKIVKQAIIATIFLLIGIGIVQYGVYSAIEQYENNPEYKLRKEVELLELKKKKRELESAK